MNLCDYCNQLDELIDFTDHLYEHRTVWLCPDCYDMASDHQMDVVLDAISLERDSVLVLPGEERE